MPIFYNTLKYYTKKSLYWGVGQALYLCISTASPIMASIRTRQAPPKTATRTNTCNCRYSWKSCFYKVIGNLSISHMLLHCSHVMCADTAAAAVSEKMSVTTPVYTLHYRVFRIHTQQQTTKDYFWHLVGAALEWVIVNPIPYGQQLLSVSVNKDFDI